MVSTFRFWALSSFLLVASPFANAAIEMYAVVDGQSQALVLEPNVRVLQEDDPATHYKGHLKDHPDSWVRVSHIDSQWSGLLSHQGQFFEVTSLSESPVSGRSSKQAQLKALDGMESLGTCVTHYGTGTPGKSAHAKALTPSNAFTQAATIDFPTDCSDTIDGVCLVAEISVFFDRSFRTAFPTQYESRGAEILNIVDGIYQNDLNIVFHQLRMDFVNGDQFTSDVDPGAILDDMLSRRVNGRIRPSDPNVRSMMHLITGRDFVYNDNGALRDEVIGLANGVEYDTNTTPPSFSPVLCNVNGSAVATSQLIGRDGVASAALTALVVAHEIGHNMGMEHDGDTATAATCNDPDNIMYPSLSGNPDSFSQCSINAAARNISALPTVEACFDFPVGLSLTADGGNIAESGAGIPSQHTFNVGMQTANGFSGDITVSGRITAGDGTIDSATLAGTGCTVTSGTRYQCSAASPLALNTLTVSFTTGFEHLTLQHEVAAGQNLFDPDTSNNTLDATVEVQGPGLPPTNLTLRHDRDRGTITLRWQDHANDELSYQIEHKLGNGGWSILTSDVPANTEQYVDNAARLVGKNAYRVRAMFDLTSSDPTNEASIEFTSNRLQDHGTPGGGGSGGSLGWLGLSGLLLLRLRKRKPALIKTRTS